ncbi:dihydroneopterin aldolase [Lysobacter korlensis]|uniref:7,8-dihydroneopterin aldolase n=1 Tax=Lysobacter korlensis TaxID=553636 RepID=A0ABV6RR77_9GAMM
MDTIFITGLQVDMLVGVYDWERQSRQPLRLDIELRLPEGAALSDGMSGAAVDYAEVVGAVRTFISTREDALLETLAEALCAHLLQRFAAASITLRIDKPQAALLLGCAHVGLTITRPRG